ncbi:MAG: NAD(P)-dependent oxidoreductase [Dermatophilaceae bacterium]
MTRRRIAITGGAGLVGTVLANGLREQFDVRIVDRAASGGDLESIRADMTDPSAARTALADANALIDLAAIADAEILWPDVLGNNIPATSNALEAAKDVGIRRVIFASSNFITGSYDLDEPYRSILAGQYDGLDPNALPLISTEMPLRPDSPYAVGKAFGEAAGRYYADRHGMSVYALRIGTVNAENRPVKPRHFAKWMSHRDLVALVAKCIEAPVPDEGRFSVFYGVSQNTWRIWDTQRAEKAVGFVASDNAEHFR